VAEDDRCRVQTMCSQLASDVVRYVDLSSESDQILYRGAGDFHRVEVMWSDLEPDVFEWAQLSEDLWFYAAGECDEHHSQVAEQDPFSRLLAVGVVNIDDIAGRYGFLAPRYAPRTSGGESVSYCRLD